MTDEERIAKLEKKIEEMQKKEQLGVRILVEFTGHMSKDDIMQFNQAWSTVLETHMENGGGGT